MVGTLIVTEDAAAAAPGRQRRRYPASGCGGSDATPADATTEATPAPAERSKPPPAGRVRRSRSMSHDIFFEPEELSIPADTDVTVQLPNEGVTPHNFSIDELGISVDIAPGATEETVINAPAGDLRVLLQRAGA